MNAVKCRKVIGLWLAVALLSLAALTACGGVLEVGVERTPTPDQAATATAAALATENARLATQVATLAVPTSTPTPSLGKLAYVQGGDIWIKALPDGQPQRLTTDGRNSAPRWSPSGEWLAFRKGDYQVWLISADGNEAHSLNEGATVDAFAWAPADDRLAYAAAAGLQVISADGAAPVTLVPPSLPGHGPGRVGHITWSPDGDWIACEWQEWQPKQPLTYQGLWMVSSDGEQLAELYVSGAPEKGEAILAGWSLDGQHIFFWQCDVLSASIMADGVALYSLPAGGGEPLKLVDTVLVHDDFLALAPQGDRLAVTAGGYRATWTNKRVVGVGAGDGELTWLTDEGVAAFSPAWSPDGVHLAYVAMPDEGDLVGGEDARLGMMERRIWVVNVQGEPQLQQLTDDPAYRDERPLWSADGNHLLFARMDAEGGGSLWLIPAVGGEPRRVVDELTPLPGPAVGWFGYYGYVEWDQLFDWWRGPARSPEGVAAPTPGPTPTAQSPVSLTLTPPLPTPTPTPQAEAPLSLLYRQGEALYAWDEATDQGRQVLELPDRAGHLALSPLGYLAYTLDDALYLTDLSAGAPHEVCTAMGCAAPDWDLRWSADGRVLAYALAYEEPDGARQVELGTYDGYEQRVVTTLTARSGPSPTPPSMPPAPGFANLQLLGHDREAGRILAAPVGGAERYKAIWAFDAATGQQTTFLTFNEPAAVQGLALSPDLTHLAVTLTPARIAIYDLTTPQVAPRTYDVPTGTHPGSHQWSPDGKWLAFLLYEGEAPGLDAMPARGLWALDVAEMQAYEVIQLESPEATLIGWRPDGKAVLVEWLDALSRQRHFQLIDAGSRQVTEFALGEGARVVGWVATPQPLAILPPSPVGIDCTDIYPGLPRCLRKESLVGGRLAFVDSRPRFDNRPTVIDLEGGGAWTLGESPAWLYSWSPSGNSLLVGGADATVWHYDGRNHSPISSPQTLFWAPRSSFEGGEEQLAIVAKDGSLLAACYTASDSTACGERLLLPPGSLGNDGRGTVCWSPDGWLAWSLNTDQLAVAGRWEQMLYVRPVEGGAETTAWCLSDNIRGAYYQLLDWVPGTRLILAGQGMMAVSLWTWGIPLVTINADTGEIIELGAAMLLTPEAYAWHPTQPGLLALAEGSSRYLNHNIRLALLDMTTGELRTLTAEGMTAFEPAWSPDGTLLAYAAVPASPDARGDGTTLEHTLHGRAIYVVNPQSGETHALTNPGDAVDGWPQWSADGTRLLYTRQHDGYTDVPVVTLDGSSDELLVTGLTDPMCYYGGCGWQQMLAYYPSP